MATPAAPIRCVKCGATDSRAYNPHGDESGWTCARGEGCRRAELCRQPLIVNAWCDGEPGHEGKCHVAGAERDEACERLIEALSADAIAAAEQRGYQRAPTEHEQRVRDAVLREREEIENRLREAAAHYDPGTDGRNTFVMMADWVSARSTAQGTQQPAATAGE